MSWGSLGTNPNQKLSEYVLAYIALAVGQQGNQVLPTAQGPSANMGGNICNGFQDGNMDPTYVLHRGGHRRDRQRTLRDRRERKAGGRSHACVPEGRLRQREDGSRAALLPFGVRVRRCPP